MAPIEFAALALLILFHHSLPVSGTPFLLALAWTSLRLRGARWRDVGLTLPRHWLTTLGLATAAGVAIEVFADFVTEPLLSRALGHPPGLSQLRPLVGNPMLLAVALVINWSLAAFGEEMVFRGYLLNRVAGLAGGTRGAWALSLVLVSAAFGSCHEGQGLTGMLQEGLAGLWLGLIYLRSGRNLVVSIVAHGVSNTLALAMIYFGHYSGL